MKKIYLALSQYLNEHNTSQYILAKRSGVNIATIRSYYRNTVRRYDADVLEKICAALDCDVSDIIECIEVDETHGK